MKVFITGSESFVGRELIRQCQARDITVVGCDLVERPSAEYEFHRADIGSPDISGVIPAGVDAVVHLAALSRDPDCRGKAYDCFQANVMGTLNLIRAIRERQGKQFIFASSEWVYDRFEGSEEKDEEAVINIANHTSEYALSKLVSEANLRQQFQQDFCPVTILRFGIIYGPRPTNWSAVESLYHAVKNGDEVTVGSRQTGRRFVHVSDIARGIIAAFGLAGFEIINLTADRVITLGEIIETSGRLLGRNPIVKETSPDQISLRNPANTKAKRLLRWQPAVDLEQGLQTLA